jgi:hypothetical protein
MGMMAIHEPVALLKLLESERTVDLFFAGLKQHYVDAIASGRTEVWRDCAHAIIDLICTEQPDFVHTLPLTPEGE